MTTTQHTARATALLGDPPPDRRFWMPPAGPLRRRNPPPPPLDCDRPGPPPPPPPRRGPPPPPPPPPLRRRFGPRPLPPDRPILVSLMISSSGLSIFSAILSFVSVSVCFVFLYRWLMILLVCVVRVNGDEIVRANLYIFFWNFYSLYSLISCDCVFHNWLKKGEANMEY